MKANMIYDPPPNGGSPPSCPRLILVSAELNVAACSLLPRFLKRDAIKLSGCLLASLVYLDVQFTYLSTRSTW